MQDIKPSLTEGRVSTAATTSPFLHDKLVVLMLSQPTFEFRDTRMQVSDGSRFNCVLPNPRRADDTADRDMDFEPERPRRHWQWC